MKAQQPLALLKVCFAAAALLAFSCLPGNAQLLVGLSYPSQGAGDNDIFTIDASNPGMILQSHPITGLQASETLRGIDFYNGLVYGLGSGGNLYTVNYNTGGATLIGSFGVALNGASFGVDNEAGGYRVVSELRQNLLVDRTTGAATIGTPLASGLFISALAWNGNTMYGIDSSANTLGILNTGTGAFSTIGLLGFDVARNNGFDIGPTGVAWLASGATSSDLQANLYMVNLSTGISTLVGLIGQPGDNTLVRGLTLVPEPGTATLALLGVGMLALIRRRH